MTDVNPQTGPGCYHCGLPLDPNFDRQFTVLDKTREFCCAGCLAVCETIVRAGMEDYYSHRREKALTADAVPEIVRKLGFYDHPEVQKSFVRSSEESREASLLLENIRCAACLWLNEQVLRGMDGVLDVQLDYASNHARVRWDPSRIRLSEILEAIINIGYVAHPYDPARREELNKLQQKRSVERLIFAGIIGMMVMQFALAGYIMGYSDETGELALWVLIGRWTSLFATTALLVYPGQEFFVGAWQDIRQRRLGMDVPIVLGLSIAYLGSLHTTWTQSGEVYYDSIAMFVFLVLLARRIEMRGRVRAADALDRIGRIVPRLATRVLGDNTEEVHASDLRTGDIVRVGPGEIVPTDGVLHTGPSSFDEALLTGESLPVSRGPGDKVISGACNVDQIVDVRVTHDSADSTVAEIHRLLAGGLREAPHYAVLAQKAAGWFVSVVLVIAAITALSWSLIDPSSALSNTVAVLIVTCPCALALATPVAAAVSAGRLADNGILQARGDALEAFAQCDTVVFDKTGTLTRGQLRVEKLTDLRGLESDQALQIAGALEQGSEHPVGRAIHAAMPADSSVAVESRRNTPGAGLQGRVSGCDWRLGKPEFAFADQPASPSTQARIDALRAKGYLVVALNSAGTTDTGALIALSDQARDGIPQMLQQLREQGIGEIAILSGDTQTGVDHFCTNLGITAQIDTALGDQSPSNKLGWIRQRQKNGARVAMIGDGINYAPTLACAEVSVSFADATELAQVNSGILILGQDIKALASIRGVAQQTRRIVRQNLAWAATYNFSAVPAAAMGLIPPWGAAIGMSASSLLVVVNALRLRAQRADSAAPARSDATGKPDLESAHVAPNPE